MVFIRSTALTRALADSPQLFKEVWVLVGGRVEGYGDSYRETERREERKEKRAREREREKTRYKEMPKGHTERERAVKEWKS